MLDTIVNLLRPLADRLGIPVDKLAHLLAGMLVSAVALLIVAPLWASLAALAVGVAKEYGYDKRHSQTETVELADIWYTWAGGSILPLLRAIASVAGLM